MNMTTLISIPTGHVRYVLAQKKSDDYAADLSSAKWPVEFVLISNVET